MMKGSDLQAVNLEVATLNLNFDAAEHIDLRPCAR